jgi:signal transduction histidine kinase
VSIALDAGHEGAELTVTDDGVGIGEQASGGYGLAGMAERVRLAGGSLRVSSVERGGTAVQVALPRRRVGEVVS